MLGRPQLTPKEQQVLEHIWQGLTMKEIANALGKGVSTVRGLRMQVFRKLGARTLVQAVRRGLELGLLEVERESGDVGDVGPM